MQEQKWHELVREEKIAELENQGRNVKGSHANNPKIELFRDGLKKENRLSDADIAELDAKNERVLQIIEIESQINPKKFAGIILITHICKECLRKAEHYSLNEKEVVLQIVYKKPVEGSGDADKLKIMKEPLKRVIKEIPGSLRDFDWEEHP
jgi:hypothetical protein